MKEVTAAIMIKEGKVFIARRGPGGSLPGAWEFPGGKVERGETPEECLKREMFEEFGVLVDVSDFYCESAYHYDHGAFNLLCYLTEHVSGDFVPTVHDDFAWVTVKELQKYPFAPADVPVVKKIMMDHQLLKEGSDGI